MNKTQIDRAMRIVEREKVLSEGAGTKGGGSLLLVIRRGTRGAVTATWFAKWKRDGKVFKRQLGVYDQMTIDDAREAFRREAGNALKDGRNPRTAARAAERPTVERLFKAYVEAMKAAGRSSWPEVERALLTGKYNSADSLGRSKAAGAVDADDVAALLGAAYERGSRVAADRTRAYLSAAFNWGIHASHDYTAGDARQDWGIAANPAASVKRDEEANTARDRNLVADELRQVWHAIAGDGYDDDTRDAVRLMIACGQRARETLRIEGAEVDLKAALWTMPAHKTKGGKHPHVVPLPRQAVEILRERIKQCGDGWLFPSRDKAELPHLTDGGVSHALRRLMVDTKMKPFQMRDLRRTWKTRTGEIGIDRFVRDLLQQHARGDTGSKHYDRFEYLPQKRDAMRKWSAWLASNVVLAPVSEREAA